MGIFKILFRKQSEDKQGWNVTPESERPDAWSKPKAPAPCTQEDEPNPFLDDEMLDTIQLKADTQHEDNPYQTHSWEMDPENDTRKLRTIQFNQIEEKVAEEVFNPYDTSEHRRGWKS
jgi:hypothetical protein